MNNSLNEMKMLFLEISDKYKTLAQLFEESDISEEKDMQENDVPVFLGIKEAITLFPVSDFTLRKWITEGKIKSLRIGDGRNAKYYIKKTDLQKMFE